MTNHRNNDKLTEFLIQFQNMVKRNFDNDVLNIILSHEKDLEDINNKFQKAKTNLEEASELFRDSITLLSEKAFKEAALLVFKNAKDAK
jgi:hypothetical protein